MRLKLIVQSPSDKNRTILIPREVAWAAARGIAKDTHHRCVLYGQFGTARFDGEGCGTVDWNEKSTEPCTTTRFAPNTTVCI